MTSRPRPPAPVIDIHELNQRIDRIVEHEARLHVEINEIIHELETA